MKNVFLQPHGITINRCKIAVKLPQKILYLANVFYFHSVNLLYVVK
jgi:hypothetical protein